MSEDYFVKVAIIQKKVKKERIITKSKLSGFIRGRWNLTYKDATMFMKQLVYDGFLYHIVGVCRGVGRSATYYVMGEFDLTETL